MVPTGGGVLGFPQLPWQGGGLYLLQNRSPILSCQLTCSMSHVTCKQVPWRHYRVHCSDELLCSAATLHCTSQHSSAPVIQTDYLLLDSPVRVSTALAGTQALCPSYLVHISLELRGRLSPVTSLCILS